MPVLDLSPMIGSMTRCSTAIWAFLCFRFSHFIKMDRLVTPPPWEVGLEGSAWMEPSREKYTGHTRSKGSEKEDIFFLPPGARGSTQTGEQSICSWWWQLTWRDQGHRQGLPIRGVCLGPMWTQVHGALQGSLSQAWPTHPMQKEVLATGSRSVLGGLLGHDWEQTLLEKLRCPSGLGNCL